MKMFAINDFLQLVFAAETSGPIIRKKFLFGCRLTMKQESKARLTKDLKVSDIIIINGFLKFYCKYNSKFPELQVKLDQGHICGQDARCIH